MMDKEIMISDMESVKDALKKLDKTAKKALLVTNNNKLLGIVTDGDIRRFLLKGKSLESDIREVYNRKYIYVEDGTLSMDGIRNLMRDNLIELLPILDKEKRIIKYMTWGEVFANVDLPKKNIKSLRVPVVIMAGGKGTRLEPFNKIVPKPLIPLGDKSISEIIMDEFKKHGITDFYMTINYRREMIISYFSNIANEYDIKFVIENDYLGTAGSLNLLGPDIGDTFIVSNCDVMVGADFEEVLNFHNAQNASLTVLSAIRHYKIPYGVIQFKEEGKIVGISEKPEYTFTVNTGVYVFSRSALSFIPRDNKCFDMTDLIRKLIAGGEKVVTYPVNENDYMDIGNWDEYKKAIAKLQL